MPLISVYGNTGVALPFKWIEQLKKLNTCISRVCRIHVSVLKCEMKQPQRLYSVRIWAPLVLFNCLRF